MDNSSASDKPIPRQRTQPAERISGLSRVATKMLQQAASALEMRRLDEAARALTGLLAIAPKHPEAMRLHGVLQYRSGKLDEAIATFESALELWPDDALILGNLGSALADLGNIERAVETLQRACECAPQMASAWFNLGKLLDHQGWPDKAEAALQRACALAPRNAAARILHAGVLKSLGRIDEAARQFRAALAGDPRAVGAWAGLIDLKTVELEPAETDRIEALAADATLSEADRMALDFARGQLLERRGDFEQALRVLGNANATMRRLHPWDAEAFSRNVDAITGAFGPDVPSAPGEFGSEVIFLVGLPRSGSTLVEQILSSHPLVEGASELPDLSGVLAEESRRRGQLFPAWVALATAQDWQRLGQRYLERTARWRRQRPRFTDKMPDNWLLAGAALSMLPAASVVDCRRDALETLWSCYKQRFAPGRLMFAYEFADLARYWHDYTRTMDYWQHRFAGHMLRQDHEALVANPQAEIRALLEFCGLPFDARCLDFHRTERAVRTLSAAQVRQPLRNDTACTANYGSLLDPLRNALAASPR
ncbi:MAG: sulfotransferase [Rhodanobacteraceae bacterium]